MDVIQARFAALLGHNAEGEAPPPALTPILAARLVDRLDSIRLFAHGYPLLTNLTHLRVKPGDMLDFAYRHELQGLCLHVLDGEENSLSRMTAAELRAFGGKARALGLDVEAVEITPAGRAAHDAQSNGGVFLRKPRTVGAPSGSIGRWFDSSCSCAPRRRHLRPLRAVRRRDRRRPPRSPAGRHPLRHLRLTVPIRRRASSRP